MVKKPILAYGPLEGAADNLLKRTRVGKMFDYDDFAGPKSFIMEQYVRWKNGHQFNAFDNKEIQKYERKELTKKLVDIFEDVT